MILIVISHSMAFWRGGWFGALELDSPNLILSTVVNWLSSFHVYSFTLVSGFIFFYGVYQGGKYKSFTDIVKKKFFRLLVPYISVSLAWVIPFQFLFFKDNLSDLIFKFLLGASPCQLWFLLMLFFVFIFSWILKDFYIKHMIGSIFLVIGFYGISIIGGYFIPNYFGIWNACRHMTLFFIGFKICQYGGTAIFDRIPNIVLIIINIIIFILWNIFADMAGLYKVLDKGFEFLLRIDGAVTAFIILERLGKKLSWKENRYIRSVSQNSMGIYLFHQQIIYCTLYLLYGRANTYLNVLVNFIVAIIVSLLISFVLHKWNVTRLLLGEK